ncbi:MAG: hypothetical protein LBI06_08470 [Treponema sp.]|nr:hypothetical protein [Treponema sp.]
MKKPLLLLPLLIVFATAPLFAQEDAPDFEEQVEAEALPEEDVLYVIEAFEFDIKGRTRPDALIYTGEFSVGEELRGQESLEKYIREKTQVLINQRVLKNNATIDYIVREQTEDGAFPVTVIIKVEDSWNIIALPRPAYSTNTGFELTIKARDYNFLGTMNPLRIDLGYAYDENGRSSFNLLIDSNTPFNAFGYTWNIDFDNLFVYRVDEPFYYKNTTGLSIEVPFRTTTFTFGFQETINLNEENSDRDKAQYGDFQDGVYMSTNLYARWKIPTGLMVYEYGELTYNAGISATFNHEIPKWPLDDIRKGPFMGFGHSLGFERIDWHNNYRKGLSVSLNNSYNYDFYQLNTEENPLSLSFSVSGTGHFIISKFFAISSRLQYRHWFYHNPEYNDQAGDALRGIANKALCADYMLSLNTDFPLRVLLFAPSEWLKTSKLRFFDFEFHVSPVIDLALYHDPGSGTSFSPKNIVATGGFEFIVFPEFMRSLYIRFGYAWNLRKMFEEKPLKFPEGDNREIYLIMGHFY